jgi:hypothetical protein
MRTAALFIACSTAIVMAQTDQPTRPKAPPAQANAIREQQVSVVVDGCVQGKRLIPSIDTRSGAHDALLNASEYLLEGPRDLIKQLTRDHDRHHEQITGIAIIPPTAGGAMVDTRTVKRGKTTITAGVRESGGGGGGHAAVAGDAKLPVRLKVASATHLSETCVGRVQ